MLIAISQRRGPEYGGADVLEASYSKYFKKFGIDLMPIPNTDRQSTRRLLSQVKVDGIILSGGGSVHPSLYGAEANPSGNYSIERDETEAELLQIAQEQDLPVLGICRGMEAINVHFGGKLIESIDRDVENALKHVRTRHDVTISDQGVMDRLETRTVEVNSYHDMGIGQETLSSELVPFAVVGDQTIEGVYHPNLAIAAIMWHPEREDSVTPVNDVLTKAFMARELFWRRRR